VRKCAVRDNREELRTTQNVSIDRSPRSPSPKRLGGTAFDACRSSRELRLEYQTEAKERFIAIESWAHWLLKSAGKHDRGEWFRVTLEDAVEAIERAERIANGQEPRPVMLVLQRHDAFSYRLNSWRYDATAQVYRLQSSEENPSKRHESEAHAHSQQLETLVRNVLCVAPPVNASSG
jgi:hypothetical protein